jgi:hypothetical protein
MHFSQQFCFHLLHKIGLHDLSPQPDDLSFADWWAKVELRVTEMDRKGRDSTITLGAWMIWNHWCIFYGLSPSLAGALQPAPRKWFIGVPQGLTAFLFFLP